MRFSFLIATILLIAGFARAAEPATKPTAQEPGNRAPDPSFAPIEDDPNLPRVLLIGDSISMGYTLPVRKMLEGKANVHRPPMNCGDSARGLKNLNSWLGEKKWDVIHFNFGLHDLKYLDKDGKYVNPPNGTQVASTEVYEKNLRELVARLKKTGAKLIWASTTPVPDGTVGRVKGDEIKYNVVAEKVMKENGIPIDDLHAVVVNAATPIQRPKNVHFTDDGYKQLAEHVTASINDALKQ
jgi:acyl-CoA thioesterase-1